MILIIINKYQNFFLFSLHYIHAAVHRIPRDWRIMAFHREERIIHSHKARFGGNAVRLW